MPEKVRNEILLFGELALAHLATIGLPFVMLEESHDREQGSVLPSASLPKGGGVLRGIGEKLSTNTMAGTGSPSVPIATSPGRAGFDVELSVGYDSGAGNGPFGIGWRLSTAAVTRKTDKGLPQYRMPNTVGVLGVSFEAQYWACTLSCQHLTDSPTLPTHKS